MDKTYKYEVEKLNRYDENGDFSHLVNIIHPNHKISDFRQLNVMFRDKLKCEEKFYSPKKDEQSTYFKKCCEDFKNIAGVKVYRKGKEQITVAYSNIEKLHHNIVVKYYNGTKTKTAIFSSIHQYYGFVMGFLEYYEGREPFEHFVSVLLQRIKMFDEASQMITKLKLNSGY